MDCITDVASRRQLILYGVRNWQYCLFLLRVHGYYCHAVYGVWCMYKYLYNGTRAVSGLHRGSEAISPEPSSLRAKIGNKRGRESLVLPGGCVYQSVQPRDNRLSRQTTDITGLFDIPTPWPVAR